MPGVCRHKLNGWEAYEMLRIRRADGTVLSPNGVEKVGSVPAQVAKAGDPVPAHDANAGARVRVLERELGLAREEIRKLQVELAAYREREAAERERNRQRVMRQRRR